MDNIESRRAYNSRLYEIADLETLCREEVANGKETFKKALEKFWRKVNNENSQEAETVRNIITSAGVILQRGKRASGLDMRYDKKSLESSIERLPEDKKEVMRKIFDNKIMDNNDNRIDLEKSFLTLTIDHAIPKQEIRI